MDQDFGFKVKFFSSVLLMDCVVSLRQLISISKPLDFVLYLCVLYILLSLSVNTYCLIQIESGNVFSNSPTALLTFFLQTQLLGFYSNHVMLL